MKPLLSVAIDGPVGVGKGDIASRLARELGLTYIYTGSMYRALALACIDRHIPLTNSTEVLRVMRDVSIELVASDQDSQYPYKVLLDGTDVTERIIEQDVAMGSAHVSVYPEVRACMVERQQEMAQGKRVVMEGRDIGLGVLPQAQLKIYLTASLEERAKRRWLQWKEKGIERSLNEVMNDTKKRDIQDMTRETDPLQKLTDAWELDTTNMTQDEVIWEIKTERKKRNLL